MHLHDERDYLTKNRCSDSPRPALPITALKPGTARADTYSRDRGGTCAACPSTSNGPVERSRRFWAGARRHPHRIEHRIRSGTESTAEVCRVVLLLMSLAVWLTNGSIDAGITRQTALVDTPTCSVSTYELKVSLRVDRSESTSLCGRILTGRIYVFLAPEQGPTSVRFYLDGLLGRIEESAPWDFAGGRPLESRALDLCSVVRLAPM